MPADTHACEGGKAGSFHSALSGTLPSSCCISILSGCALRGHEAQLKGRHGYAAGGDVGGKGEKRSGGWRVEEITATTGTARGGMGQGSARALFKNTGPRSKGLAPCLAREGASADLPPQPLRGCARREAAILPGLLLQASVRSGAHRQRRGRNLDDEDP